MKSLPFTKSLASRLVVSVIGVVVAVFGLTFYAYLTITQIHIEKDTEGRIQLEIEKVALNMGYIMSSVESAVKNHATYFAFKLEHPAPMHYILHNMLQENPNIYSCNIAFEPYYFNDNDRLFCPLAYRNGQNHNDDRDFTDMFLGTDNSYEYQYKDWYQTARLLHKPHWTDPYFDEGITDRMVVTYSYPLYDKYGNLAAVISANILLSQIIKQVNSVQVYPKSWSFMIGQTGTFISHPDTTRVMNETIFTPSLAKSDTALVNLGKDMLNGLSSHKLMTNRYNKEKEFVFYAPIPNCNWSIAVVCPQTEVLAANYEVSKWMFIIAGLGLVVLLGITTTLTRRMVKPIKELAVALKDIANSDFQITLQQNRTNTHSEIDLLYQSFTQMQTALHKHIHELQLATKKEERLASELTIATDIQQSMLPKNDAAINIRPDINIYGRLIPAREVGGDLYDFFIVDDKLFFCIGDVSGKGVPAALIMSMAQSILHTIAHHSDTPKDIINSLNKSICEYNPQMMFVTMFFGILDLNTGIMRFCNAGHNAPLHYRRHKKPYFMDIKPNIALGIFPNYDFEEQSVALCEGDCILLYTDGVTEAENEQKQMFREDRLAHIIENLTVSSQRQVVDSVIEAVREHSKGVMQTDDITLLGFKYTPDTGVKLDSTIHLQNDINEVKKLYPFVMQIAQKLKMTEDGVFKVNLALEEVIVNIINYAYPDESGKDITLHASLVEGSLVFTITDTGIPFDPTSVEDIDSTLSVKERPIGGLGVFLVRSFMDNLEYCHTDGKNILTLTKCPCKKAVIESV